MKQLEYIDYELDKVKKDLEAWENYYELKRNYEKYQYTMNRFQRENHKFLTLDPPPRKGTILAHLRKIRELTMDIEKIVKAEDLTA